MDDLISRQAAIDILYKFAGCIVDTPNGDYCRAYEASRYKLETLPSVQPERKSGKWIPHGDDDGEHYGDRCSVCGEWYVMIDGRTNYCPNCGADMRGEEDEMQ